MIDAAPILVADDNSDDVELLKRAMVKAGLPNPIRFVTDGCQAIEYLQQSSELSTATASCPLLMFLDLNMPRCTGFGVLNWLRQQPHLRSLPTIVFSNSDQPSDIENSFRLGAQCYWVKPSRFEDLVKLMIRLKDILRDVASRLEPDAPLPVAA